MKVFLRDADECEGCEIADVDPREVEAVYDTVRLQRVYGQDSMDTYPSYSWQFVYGNGSAFAEIIMHPEDA